MKGVRRVSARAEVRLEAEIRFPVWLCAVGSRRLRLCLREADAVAARDAAAEGAEVSVRLAGRNGESWAPISDLRLGAVRGSGKNAVRMAALLTPDISPETADLLPAVLVAANDERGAAVCRALPALRGIRVVPAQEVLDPAEAVGALLLGGAPKGALEVESVRAAIRQLPGLRTVLVSEGGAASPHWGELVVSGEIFFACSGWPEADQLTALVLSALDDALFRRAFRELVAPDPETEDGFPAFAWYDASLLRERRAVQGVLRDLAAQAERRLPEITAAVYAYDDWAEVLLGPHPVQEQEFAESAASGLTAYAARTGSAVVEERAGDTVFFDRELDLVAGAGGALLAVPIRDFAGTVFGVLACHPADEHGGLPPDLIRGARLLASEFAPPLAALREHDRLQGSAGANPSVFRAEAIDEYRRSESPSSILNVSERWGALIVGGMAALLLAFMAFLFFGRGTEYAEGNAIVRSRGRVPVIANAAGTVAAVRLAPDRLVRMGEEIGTLYDAAELAKVERLEREYEEALVRLLRNPNDPAAGSGLATLRGTSVEARAALDARQLTAPTDGVLADLRIRVGAVVSPGQVVATVRTAGSGFEIVAALPGNYRPMLRSGLPVVAELDQFPGSRFHLEAAAVSPEVVSPEEARALMGRAVPLGEETGVLALVYADLPEVLSSSGGAEYPLYDGMRGSVRIPVRQERFIQALWPALGERR